MVWCDFGAHFQDVAKCANLGAAPHGAVTEKVTLGAARTERRTQLGSESGAISDAGGTERIMGVRSQKG